MLVILQAPTMSQKVRGCQLSCYLDPPKKKWLKDGPKPSNNSRHLSTIAPQAIISHTFGFKYPVFKDSGPKYH